MMPELKPCPFCGQTEPEYITPYENGKHPYVMCPTCLASTVDAGDVIRLWNARPVEGSVLLRAALKRLVYEVTHLSPLEEDGSHKCKIGRQALNQARDALAQSSATRPDGGDSLREAVKDVLEWDGGLHSLGYDGTKAVKARDFLKKWLNSALAAKDGE